MSGEPCVTILMAVYDGAACLSEQLESIRAQTHRHWHLVTSDDGSTDDSAAILARFAAEVNAEAEKPGTPMQVTNLRGPGQGAAANFLHLLRRLPEPHGWTAFADQDDVWLDGRLTRGLAALTDIEGPALYCSRTWVASEDLSTRRLSAARPRPPGFRNALVQNIAAGNTILLNPAATAMIARTVSKVERIVMHDWWCYLLVSGSGGAVAHDDTPTLLYRQHGRNEVGSNGSTRARLRRIHRLLRGDFRDWNALNVAALRANRSDLTPKNRALLEDFARLPQLPLLARLRLMASLRLYRQTTISTLALWLAAISRRI